MIIFTTTNILALPVLILAWTADVFLLFSVLRLLLGRLPSLAGSQVSMLLKALVDPVHDAVDSWIAEWRKEKTPKYVAWFVLIAALMVIRQLLFWIIMTTT
jgi:hypothetical protein